MSEYDPSGDLAVLKVRALETRVSSLENQVGILLQIVNRLSGQTIKNYTPENWRPTP